MRLRLSFFYCIVIIYAIISVTFALQLAMTEQEAYYWLWAKHLDWSYFDHPPLQAWVTALFTSVFGDEKWVVRLPAALGDLATLVLFYQWTRLKWDQKTAELSSLLMMSSTVFMMGSVIALPDSLAVPLGLTAMIFADKGSSRKAGFFLGLALLGKWTVLFIAPGILYSFYRQKKLQPWHLANIILIPLLMQAPVIWWNILHGEVSLKFHLYERHSHEILSLAKYLQNAAQFFLAQFFSVGLLTTTLLIALALRFTKNKYTLSPEVRWSSIAAWTLPGLIIVFISATQGQIRFYWTFLSLLPVIAIVGYLATIHFSHHYKTIYRAAIAVMIFHWSLAFIAGFLPIGQTLESAFKLKSDLRHSPMGEFYGWKNWYDEVVAPSGLIDDQTAMIGSDLHVSSRLSWAVRKEKSLTVIGVAGNSKNQFMFWPQPEPPRFTKALFFADNRYDRFSNFDSECTHAVEWKTSYAKVYNRPVKEIYWAFCNSLK